MIETYNIKDYNSLAVYFWQVALTGNSFEACRTPPIKDS